MIRRIVDFLLLRSRCPCGDLATEPYWWSRSGIARWCAPCSVADAKLYALAMYGTDKLVIGLPQAKSLIGIAEYRS